MQVRGGRSLYFLVSPTFNSLDSSIVRTNGAGRVEQTTKLPAKASIQDFEVDAAGMLYVLLMMPGTEGQAQVMVYRPDGRLGQAVPVSHHVIWLCAVGNTVLTVAGTETGLALAGIGSESKPLASVTLRRTSRLMALPLPDGRIAAVEPTAGVVHLIDLQRASEVSVRPRVPEMQWLATLPPGDHTRNAAFQRGDFCAGRADLPPSWTLQAVGGGCGGLVSHEWQPLSDDPVQTPEVSEHT